MKNKNQETSFCACRKASLTVESAIVIPLTAGLLISILFFFRLLQVQAVVDEALMYAGRQIAVESSVVTSEEVLILSAKGFLAKALKDEPQVKYIKNNVLGIKLLGTRFQEDKIILKANYEMALPVAFFGQDAISLYSQNIFYKWTGTEATSESEEYVYVSTYGTVYHATTTCQAIDIKVKKGKLSSINTLRGANGQKYYKCSKCVTKTDLKNIYYTEYGTLYHGEISCKYLKRNVKKVPVSEVGEKEKCSFCY